MDGGTTVLLGAACALACAVGTYYWRGRSAADQEEGGAGAAASTENALSGGGGAAAQRMFESVGAMEAWLAEGGWSCLLVVGNNSRGYSEASFSVRERPQPASLAAPAERRRALRRRRRPACALYSTTRRRTARWVRRSASRAPCRARALIGSRGVRAGRARSAKRLLVVFGGDGVNPGAPPLSRRARLNRPLPPRACSAEMKNIASVVQWLQTELQLPLLAVTCDRVAREWGGVDPHVDYVRLARPPHPGPEPECPELCGV